MLASSQLDSKFLAKDDSGSVDVALKQSRQISHLFGCFPVRWRRMSAVLHPPRVGRSGTRPRCNPSELLSTSFHTARAG